jgi:hypothetical protein
LKEEFAGQVIYAYTEFQIRGKTPKREIITLTEWTSLKFSLKCKKAKTVETENPKWMDSQQ